VLLACSIFTPRSVDYSEIRFVRLIPGLINVIVVPALVVVILALYRGGFKPIFILYGVIALFAAKLTSAQVNYDAKVNDLAANGVWGKAIVIDRRPTPGSNGTHPQIKCRYMVNGRSFETLYERDAKNTYKKGDTLDIQYVKDFPRMYSLKRAY
jgi:hypothetical protein